LTVGSELVQVLDERVRREGQRIAASQGDEQPAPVRRVLQEPDAFTTVPARELLTTCRVADCEGERVAGRSAGASADGHPPPDQRAQHGEEPAVVALDR